MKIKISSLSNIQKEAQFFSNGQLKKSINLSNQKQSVDNIDYPVFIKVAYSQSIAKKTLGFFAYIVMMLTGVNGNELVDSVYIDTIEILDGGNEMTLVHSEKSPFFLVEESKVKYNIKRKVNIKDYVLLNLVFFLPMLIILSLLLFLFATSGVEILLRLIGITVVGLLIMFLLYQMVSLYKKTR